MAAKCETATVVELQRAGILLVEDGNHGEYRPRSDEFDSEGVAFIRAADMDAGRVLFDRASKINTLARQRIRKGVGAPGDILLSHKGTVGKVSIVPDDAPPFVCSPQTTFWRCLDEGILNPRYLYAFLRSPTFASQLAIRAGETDMAPYVSLTSQRALEITVPPLPEQQAIAHIVGTLDDKIELNRRMSQTLEAMARALFKSWFVDFDPVRAKMEGRDTGLPKRIAELFPARLVDSELGEIPEGWKLKPLDSVANFQNGLALQKFRPSQGEARLPVVKIAQLRAGEASNEEWASATIKPECIIDNGDVVFSWSGSLLVQTWCGGRAALNQHLFKVTSERYPKWFYLHSILSHLPEFQRIASGKATTMGHIKRHHLTDAACVVPPDDVIAQVPDMLEELPERAVVNELECRTLATLRDTLLPKLVSGELRVNALEAAVGLNVDAVPESSAAHEA